MNDNLQFAYRVRQALNQGTQTLAPLTATRLQEARSKALARHQPAVGGLSLAGFGRIATESLSGHVRVLLAALALMIGAASSYYWNNIQRATEHAEIDSALLADEVPFSAYLDQGFVEWLDRIAQEEDSSLAQDSLPQDSLSQ